MRSRGSLAIDYAKAICLSLHVANPSLTQFLRYNLGCGQALGAVVVFYRSD
jgi:hypothetical protein